jgi:hypothetical protein
VRIRGGPAAVIGDTGCIEHSGHWQKSSCREGAAKVVDPGARRRVETDINTALDGKEVRWKQSFHWASFFIWR